MPCLRLIVIVFVPLLSFVSNAAILSQDELKGLQASLEEEKKYFSSQPKLKAALDERRISEAIKILKTNIKKDKKDYIGREYLTYIYMHALADLTMSWEEGLKFPMEERVKYRREAFKINAFQWMGRVSFLYEETFKVNLPDDYRVTYLSEAMKIYPENEFIEASLVLYRLQVIEPQSLNYIEQLLMKEWKSASAKTVALQGILKSYYNFLAGDIFDKNYDERYSRIAETAVLDLDFLGKGSGFGYDISTLALGVVLHRQMDSNFTQKFLRRLYKHLGDDKFKYEVSRSPRKRY